MSFNSNHVKLFLLIGFLPFYAAVAHGQVSSDCLSGASVRKLITFFPQVGELAVQGENVCKSDVGPKWFHLIGALVDLKNLQLEDRQNYKTQDDLSFESIEDNGWWNYLTARVTRFELNPTFCRTGVVAYVSFYAPGLVHICEPYYSSDRISRLEVLLHEVRHFDGHGHVTCLRGQQKGVQGACDEELFSKGSYAVSMQASVTLALRGQGFSEAERALGKAGALFYLSNRFNKETDVKIKESLFLENQEGQIFEWNPSSAQLKFVKKLKEPAHIYSSSMDIILYPLNPSQEAYRMTEDFSVYHSELGLYAKTYNSKTTQERAQYKALAYNNGGFLTETGYSSICGSGMVEVKESEFPEPLNTMITLDKEGQNLVDYVVGASGRLYRADCSIFGDLIFKPQEEFLPQGLHRTSIVGEQRYALTQEGQIFELNKEEKRLSLGQPVNFSGVEQNWIEMTTRTVPYLYDEVSNKRGE